MRLALLDLAVALVLALCVAFYAAKEAPYKVREHPAYCMNHFGIPHGFDRPWAPILLGHSAWRCDQLFHQRSA